MGLSAPGSHWGEAYTGPRAGGRESAVTGGAAAINDDERRDAPVDGSYDVCS